MKSCLNSLKFSGLALLIVSLFAIGIAQAAIEGGDAKKGKILAKEKCKYCHVTGAEGGTMTPLSKTQRQWERFYSKDKHNKKAPGTWDKINPNELIDIMQFMYDHAADSPQPATCGQ
ncbi:MAG: cytochrome c [Desulfuromonadales bacterium]|nr:cytochrome c [Desulfuromonadales bacterium]